MITATTQQQTDKTIQFRVSNRESFSEYLALLSEEEAESFAACDTD